MRIATEEKERDKTSESARLPGCADKTDVTRHCTFCRYIGLTTLLLGYQEGSISAKTNPNTLLSLRGSEVDIHHMNMDMSTNHNSQQDIWCKSEKEVIFIEKTAAQLIMRMREENK